MNAACKKSETDRTPSRDLPRIPIWALYRARRLRGYLALAAAAGYLGWLVAPGAAAGGDAALAYIGPGAGIALGGGLLTLVGTILLSLLLVVTFPFVFLWRAVRYGRVLKNAKVKRAIVVGLDGLETSLVEEMIENGELPNLARIREQGAYTRLGTTWPPLSPVAWSSFTTGSNPGKHNIFDFIDRTPNYSPTMSSVRIRETKKRKLLGFIPVPGSGAEIVGLRRSKPFWTVLGENGVFSSILRVPITYPPDKFKGVQLSAMCAPDLRGTLGMFTFYTDQGEAEDMSDGGEGGDKLIVERKSESVSSYLRGPVNTLHPDKPEMRIPFTVEPGKNGADALLKIHGEIIPLIRGKFTDWTPVHFSMGFQKVHGICRFYLRSFKPFEMYCSPIMIDPDKPVVPIAHPLAYSSYLARTQGPYNTLGLAEDTGALDRHVLDEDAFLEHAYSIHAEREKMFFDALRKTRRGTIVCVFDGPDRIQHMFWRFLDDKHPAVSDEQRPAHKHVIREMYKRMDALVGRVMKQVDKNTALFVMSDHGFNSFRRGVDLNAWLRDNGYLAITGDKPTADASWLKDIDWSRTRAFALGLAGIFINQKARENDGIVAPGQETADLVREICEKLTGLTDPETDELAIKEALPRGKAFSGPYTENAPDILVGYATGYRVSWDAAIGKASAEVFSDNMKAWSGDHCVHPQVVPGVLFTNQKIGAGPAAIIDIGPTILELFGIKTPAYMDGRSLLGKDRVGPEQKMNSESELEAATA